MVSQNHLKDLVKAWDADYEDPFYGLCRCVKCGDARAVMWQLPLDTGGIAPLCRVCGEDYGLDAR